MRLAENERRTIVHCIRTIDPQSEVWLFGSRTNDNLKGGDIDLLVISAELGFKDRIDILVQVKLAIGEQKIDLHLIKPEERDRDALAVSVLPGAIRLA